MASSPSFAEPQAASPTRAQPARARRRTANGAAPGRPAVDALSAEAGSTARIVDAVTTAIVERRLAPGTRLAEQKIADLFGVSRTIVRQALNRLSRDKLVTLEPARGARVARPSLEEARQVFEVRGLLESAMAARLGASITAAQVAELRRHVADEQAAVRRTDVSGRTRLLADFHVVMARLLGNAVLAELLADLLSRCSLISLMHPSSHAGRHSSEEHGAIVDALERGDGAAAAALMQDHLRRVERDLHLDPRAPDLAAALRPGCPAASDSEALR